MFSKPKIFMLVAVAACLFASESNAQVGQQAAFRAARFIAVRNSPALQTGQIVRSGNRIVNGQFLTGPQRSAFGVGGGVGTGNNLQAAGRLFRVGRFISRF